MSETALDLGHLEHLLEGCEDDGMPHVPLELDELRGLLRQARRVEELEGLLREVQGYDGALCHSSPPGEGCGRPLCAGCKLEIRMAEVLERDP